MAVDKTRHNVTIRLESKMFMDKITVIEPVSKK